MSARNLIGAIAIILMFQVSACENIFSTVNSSKGYLTSTAEIAKNPDRFLGRSVVVRNDAIERIGDSGFLLDLDGLTNNEPILTIDLSSMPSITSDDGTPEVLVRGIVKTFNLKQLQQEYNLNLDRQLYEQYEGKTVIVANSIILSPDPENLTDRPELYYDLPLAVQGEVDDVEDEYGLFELDEEKAFGGEDLLVLTTKPVELAEDRMVVVFGVLRSFVAAQLQQDYQLDWNLSTQKKLEAEYNQKPVFIADRIEILN